MFTGFILISHSIGGVKSHRVVGLTELQFWNAVVGLKFWNGTAVVLDSENEQRSSFL